MIQRLRHFLEMIRFSHTIFALPFALLAAVMAWLAPGGDGFRWQQLVGVVVCMAGARTAAMAFNRLADRKIDAGNPRTAGRHLPAGTLSVTSVVAFMLISVTVYFGGALLFLPNLLPVILAAPVLAFLCAYSYTKRFTSLAHFWLGASLMLAPVCAWVAIRGDAVLQLPADIAPAAILGVAVLLWVSGFDMIYACQDYEFDVKARLHSIPTMLGVRGALRLAAACHMAMVLALAALPFAHLLGGPELSFGWIYYISVAAVACLLTYEHALVRPDDLTRVNIAFFNVNSIISVGLFVVVTIDLLT